MYDELVKRLHRYSGNCVAYKLDADFADAVQQAADAIEELSKPRWIPVTERLPKQGKRYLVIRFGGITKAQFIDILWHDAHDLWWNRLYKGQYNVTHWMPLPRAPEEE